MAKTNTCGWYIFEDGFEAWYDGLEAKEEKSLVMKHGKIVRFVYDSEIPFSKLTKEAKLSCYESYVGECIYEDGDYVEYLSYEEWCAECEKFGWAIF